MSNFIVTFALWVKQEVELSKKLGHDAFCHREVIAVRISLEFLRLCNPTAEVRDAFGDPRAKTHYSLKFRHLSPDNSLLPS